MKRKELHRLARELSSNGISSFRKWKRVLRKSLKLVGLAQTRIYVQEVLQWEREHPICK